MSKYLLPWTVPLMLTAAGAGLLAGWIYSYYHLSVPMRLPGEDGRPSALSFDASSARSKQGTLETFDGAPARISGSWPTFRGSNYDAVSTESVPLIRSFPSSGPKELWRVSLGEGYAGPAVRNGRVFLIDYDMARQADAIRCFSLEDGREIWRYSYPVAVKRNHGMSRTIPAVDGRYVVTIGPRCDVTCLEAETGQFRWAIDLVKEYGTQEPLWYAGQCPRIEDGKAVLAPAGKDVLMMAVDCESGQVVWKTPNPRRWQMTHSSILPIFYEGRRMYVYCAVGGVAGIAADDGTLLWETDAWTLRIHVPTPVWLGDGRLFFSAGYNKGSMMMRLVKQQDTILPEVLFALPPEVFGADQQTPIYYQGFLYGVRPNKELVCLDLDGKIRWSSGPQNKFGLGPYIIADGMIIVLNDEGVLSLIEARPDEFVLLAKAKVLDGPESWAPPALVEGRLLVRDFTTMKCLDLRKRE